MNHQNLISLICIFCLIAFGFLSPTVQAQETLPNSPVGTGQLKGKVKDSTYNFMLTSATIAVYKAADSSLLQYGLPNNFVEFSISSLPIDTPLRLIITHVGYRPLMKKFSITPSPSFGGGRGGARYGTALHAPISHRQQWNYTGRSGSESNTAHAHERRYAGV